MLTPSSRTCTTCSTASAADRRRPTCSPKTAIRSAPTTIRTTCRRRLARPARSSQPDHFNSRVVLAATTKPQPTTDAAKDETLPPPQIDGSHLEGQVPLSGWDAAGNVDVAKRTKTATSRWSSATPRSARSSRILGQNYHLNIVAANDIDVLDLDHAQRRAARASAHVDPRRGQLHLGRAERHHHGHLDDRVRSVACRHPRPRRSTSSSSTLSAALARLRSRYAMLSPIGKMSIIKSDSHDNKPHPRDDRRRRSARVDLPHRRVPARSRSAAAAGLDGGPHPAGHAQGRH